MEELQVIETTSGRQFKPWASREDVQAIEQAVEQAVQDPASVTAVASEIASGKQAIAAAINAKGGTASASESFSELAQDIQDTPTSGVLSNGIVQSEPFSFLDYVCKQGAYPFTEIDDDSVTVIDRESGFSGRTNLLKVKMTALRTISGGGVFQNCSALQEVDMPNLRSLSGGNQWFGGIVEEFYFPSLEEIYAGGAFANNSHLLRVILPSVKIVNSASLMYASDNIQRLEFGSLTTFTAYSFNTSKNKLRNITIGAGTNIDLPFQNWTATNVIAEGQSGIDELNTNLYNNLLTKLYDHSQDGQTRTLRIGWLANVTAENIAYANAKGWTLTT